MNEQKRESLPRKRLNRIYDGCIGLNIYVYPIQILSNFSDSRQALLN